MRVISAGSARPEAAGHGPPGPPRPPPPPLLPKPGKDNLRLQKLLRRTGRKRPPGGCPPPSPGAFRISLSPVSEASHDQEAAAPRPPEAGPAGGAPPRPPHATAARPGGSPRAPHGPAQHQARPGPRPPAPGPQLPTWTAGPAPAPRGSSPARLPAPVARRSQVQLRLAPAPQAGGPEHPRKALGQGLGGQDPGAAPSPPPGQSPVPVARICPLPIGAQAAPAQPQANPAPPRPPGFWALVSRRASPRAVVPVAPTYRSPLRHGPAPAPQDPGSPPKEAPPPGPAAETRETAPPSPPPGPPPCPLPGGAPRPQPSGWTRLKQQLMAEPDGAPPPGPPPPGPPASRASRLWDAVLYRVALAEAPGDGPLPLGARGRLPFLCRPRFNARKLQGATPRAPPTPGPGLGLDTRPKDFNRTAAGWKLP